MAQSEKPELQVERKSFGKVDFEHLEISDAVKQLCTDPKSGLSDTEAEKRLEEYGPNALPEKKVSAFEMFGKFFWGPMPWMIEAAAIISTLVKDLIDFIIIMVMLLFNAALGFWHERQAASALDALKGALAQQAQVLRGGKSLTVLANPMVPGDIVGIRLGNVVPADVKLLEGAYRDADQLALTGKSLPVSKAPGDLTYSGSIAVGDMVPTARSAGRAARQISYARIIGSCVRQSADLLIVRRERGLMNIGVR